MSKIGKTLIHPSRNEFIDRQIYENETFPELTVRLDTIDSMLLLLDAEEEMVLVAILKHITDFIRRNDDNVALLREKNMLELMMPREYYRTSSSVIIRRFALYLTASIVESMNTLVDLESTKTMEIIQICLQYYVGEEDDFCVEYLSVIINKCLDDPQVVKIVLKDLPYVEKFNDLQVKTTNPDVILHSFELLEKMLLVQCLEELQDFIAQPSFPINRILCELTSEFVDIRRAALKVLRIVILETNSGSPLNKDSRKVYVLEQLTQMLCDNLMPGELNLVVEVIAAALRKEDLAQLFFEYNQFERYMTFITNDTLDHDTVCKLLLVLTEAAKYVKFLPRLATAEVSEKLIKCLIEQEIPATHILMGLNRMMKCPDACNRIVEAYEQGVISRLLNLVANIDIDIKTREQSSYLLQNLLPFAFHRTASEMLDLNITKTMADIFGRDSQYQSTDLVLSLLNIIETLADNCDYRERVCENESLITNIATLLMNSFSTAIVVNNIFRCLCTLVDAEPVRRGLLKCYISSSIKRALKSMSNLVKTSVTNFIMQTSRFKDFVCEYIGQGVLDVLILHQKHAFCVPTWGPAIDSILAKSPTLKFCIRNHLSFTDLTTGQDFFVSKNKFDDFRIFQSLLRDEVSPLHPVLVVNFDRPVTPQEMIVTIPMDCLTVEECRQQKTAGEWCYCRTPGDAQLPAYLEEVNANMEAAGLAVSPSYQRKFIDFENIAKRAKIISQVVSRVLGKNLSPLDLNSTEDCSQHAVKCHLKDLARELHCTFVPLGRLTTGCQFERAVLFKALADQVGLPCTLQRSVDGRMLFNELPLPIEMERDQHCDPKTMALMPWRMLRPTHIVDLMYNVGELYPIQSRQALQYLKLY